VRFVAKLRTIWPHLWQSRMALAGCLVGEGETGAIEPVEVAIPLVAESLEKYARSQGISLVAFKDFPTKMRSAFSCLSRWGYARVAGFPPLTLELNFASFDEYMAMQLSRDDPKKFNAENFARLMMPRLRLRSRSGPTRSRSLMKFIRFISPSLRPARFGSRFSPANIFSKQVDARRENSAISFGDKVVAQSPSVFAQSGMEHCTITILVWITRSRTS
jgi:hypothetical protein